MATKQYIEINEFMTHLQARGLVLVRQDDLVSKAEADLQLLRNRLLAKPWLTLKEVIDTKLLPITSKQGLRTWIKNETIRSNEHKMDGRERIVILTKAVKRLAYIE